MQITPEDLFGPLLIAKQGNLKFIPNAPVYSDSRKVEKGSIFAAIPGTAVDGHDFIPAVLTAGVSMVIHSKNLGFAPPQDILFCQVSDVRQAFSLLCRHFCGNPDEKLKVYGVTGTNGKTTSVYLLRHLLDAAGLPCGLISTVEFCDGENTLPATHTTPDPQTLYPLLDNMTGNGINAVAMEFSSHALDQKRIHGISLHGAIFTNLTGDHLDYHQDMENYYQAKKILFTSMLKKNGIAAINIDSPAGCRLAEELSFERPDLKIPTFGRSENAGWRISQENTTITGCSFILSNAKQAFQVNFPLPGEYNITNLAGVLTLVLCDNISPEAIDRALSTPLQVPGRVEYFPSPSGAHFFVDYAHTDDALANVLAALKKLCTGKLTAVFGAGGNRDKSKRPRMGAAAAKFADRLIITSDNPRFENPEDIISQIVAGLPENTAFETIVSRRDAIAHAVKNAQKDDVILIAGKGHENYQVINGIKHPFDDREILKQLIEKQL